MRGDNFGDATARLFLMRSHDLTHWSEPELIPVKGQDVPEAEMGRMIDPYLLEDKDTPGRWWCFYKQNGASMSYTDDFRTWTYAGRIDCGENVCVLVEDDEYVLFHSPAQRRRDQTFEGHDALEGCRASDLRASGMGVGGRSAYGGACFGLAARAGNREVYHVFPRFRSRARFSQRRRTATPRWRWLGATISWSGIGPESCDRVRVFVRDCVTVGDLIKYSSCN